MTIYRSSSATSQITIQELEYSTLMTIFAPSLVDQGAPFPISGRLSFMEGGVEYGLGGRTISLTYNGTSLGSVTTDGGGYYAESVIIDTSGTYTLTAAFAGSTGLAASNATTGVQIGEISLGLLAFLGVLAYLMVRK